MADNGTLVNIPLWDGQRYQDDCDVVWDSGIIRGIRPHADGLSSAGTDTDRTIRADAPGMDGLCVIPGLIDTHLHLWYPTGNRRIADTSAWPLYTPPEERSLHVLGNALACMRNGVTTMRDMSSHSTEMAVARALDEQVVPGPRLLVNGEVGMSAGHGDLFTPPRARQRNPVADSPDECRKLVRSWAREGTTGIKLYLSGGVLSMGDKVGWRNQTIAEIRATIDEAHALGFQVAAHTHTVEGIQIALDEHVDSIEHATAMTDEQMDAIAERHIPVAPTLLINDRIAHGNVPVSPEARDKARRIVEHRDDMFRKAADRGVRFVLGTDACSSLVAYGDQMEEVRDMVRVFGWNAERALHAATADAADAMRIGDTIGRLQAGYGADLLVMRGRPWERIEDLRLDNIVAVISRGALVRGTLPRTAV